LLESGVKHHNPKTNCLLNINKECLFSQHWQIILFLLSSLIPRDLMLEGDNGLLMPALKVFSESIKYLRGHLENHLQSKQGIGGYIGPEGRYQSRADDKGNMKKVMY
jgi:hypothetical protein